MQMNRVFFKETIYLPNSGNVYVVDPPMHRVSKVQLDN